MLLTFKIILLRQIALVMLACHTVSCEVDGSFSNTSTRLCSWILYQFLWFGGFFVSGGRQECLFILSNNFLQANADLPYKQIFKKISCLSSFKFVLNCVMEGNRKFRFVRLFPPVEHILIC